MEKGHDLYEITKDIIIPLCGSILSFTALLIAIRSLAYNTKVARANFELQMTLSHRDTWRKIGELGLTRIKDKNAETDDITEPEETNVNFVLHNVKNMYDAMEKGLLSKGKNRNMLMKDIGEFFLLPIPNKVWERLKEYHHDEFKAFMQESRSIYLGGELPPKGIKKILRKLKNLFNYIKRVTINMKYKLFVIFHILKINVTYKYHNLIRVGRNIFNRLFD